MRFLASDLCNELVPINLSKALACLGERGIFSTLHFARTR